MSDKAIPEKVFCSECKFYEFNLGAGRLGTFHRCHHTSAWTFTSPVDTPIFRAASEPELMHKYGNAYRKNVGNHCEFFQRSKE